jgi:L-alanine-DL-glutamate epimerase-like enolase superfamily enzyme
MMKGEKPGGHGERCVAVGALDMAIWDAASKIAEKPLYRFLGDLVGNSTPRNGVSVYAGGGYYFPSEDIRQLTDEIRQFLDLGYTCVKIKIGGRPLDEDLQRIESALSLLPNGAHLAVDAMNRYDPKSAIEAAQTLAPYRLRWFEDMCDPLAGEALFSLSDARNLIRYGGLRPDRDVLVFDPAHCYGIPEYLRIIEIFEDNGWSRSAFQPHGGHLFSLHVAAGLRLGGSESNPHNFQPFGGFADGSVVEDGSVRPPDAPGIGFETRSTLGHVFHSLLEIDEPRDSERIKA